MPALLCSIRHALTTLDAEQYELPRDRPVVDEEPPSHLSFALAGLWWDAKGNWKRAHESAQQDEDPSGSWVHAYLHRKEGDASNAGYWYRRAGKLPAQGSLEEEWLDIAKSLLSEAGPDL